jgi:hypothetical protein
MDAGSVNASYIYPNKISSCVHSRIISSFSRREGTAPNVKEDLKYDERLSPTQFWHSENPSTIIVNENLTGPINGL